ncbi:MAG: hypothetical protein ACIAQF_01515 [Phycisphaerales bacterium JB065]
MTKRILTVSFTAAMLAQAALAGGNFWEIGSGTLSTGISDGGAVVGDNNNTGQYFLWTLQSGMMDIGGQVAGQGIGGSSDISDDGLFVGGTVLNSVTGVYEFGRYDINAGTWTPLGGLGAVSGVETSSGWAISGDGSSVVGLGWVTSGGAHAVQWKDGEGVSDLGSTVEDRSSRANGVNSDGSVVVGWQDGAGRQGAVWIDGVQELIFRTNGTAAQEAYKVTDDGEWVIGIDVAGIVGVADFWRYSTSTGTYENLGNLATGGQSRAAGNAITDDGSIIAGGTWGLGPATFGTAIIWTAETGTIRFGDWLSSKGVDFDEGYNFAFVTDVSSDGTWFTGWGRNAANELGSWVVQIAAGPDCPADVDGSGGVDLADLNLVLANFGQTTDEGDTNGDGEVDLADLNAVLAAFGTHCE